MKIRISHSAWGIDGKLDWFVVHPLEGKTAGTGVIGNVITHDKAVMSLLAAGRSVYELELPDDPDNSRMDMGTGIWKRITLTP